MPLTSRGRLLKGVLWTDSDTSAPTGGEVPAAGYGSVLSDAANKKFWINTGTEAAPVWEEPEGGGSPITLIAETVTQTPLTVGAMAGQTAGLAKIQNVDGTKGAFFGSMVSTAGTDHLISLKPWTGQTGKVFVYHDIAGTEIGSISVTGYFTHTAAAQFNGNNGTGGNPNASVLYTLSSASSHRPFVMRAHSAQAVSVLEAQAQTGTVYASIGDLTQVASDLFTLRAPTATQTGRILSAKNNANTERWVLHYDQATSSIYPIHKALDAGVILQTQNASASDQPQFSIVHDSGYVNMSNLRGGTRYVQGATREGFIVRAQVTPDGNVLFGVEANDGTDQWKITDAFDMTVTTGNDFIFGTTGAGTKIGTGATQLIGVWGNTPIVRPTGYVAATGTATRATFATGSVTLAQLAEQVMAIKNDLMTIGWFGA